MKIPRFATLPVPDAVKFALVQQLAVITLAGMILDGGATAQICFLALAAFWGGSGVLLARRHGVLTYTDNLLIKWGYLPLCIASFFFTHWI